MKLRTFGTTAILFISCLAQASLERAPAPTPEMIEFMDADQIAVLISDEDPSLAYLASADSLDPTKEGSFRFVPGVRASIVLPSLVSIGATGAVSEPNSVLKVGLEANLLLRLGQIFLGYNGSFAAEIKSVGFAAGAFFRLNPTGFFRPIYIEGRAYRAYFMDKGPATSLGVNLGIQERKGRTTINSFNSLGFEQMVYDSGEQQTLLLLTTGVEF